MPTYSQLLELRIIAREAKSAASSLYGALLSNDMTGEVDLDIDESGRAIRIDDFGWLCDEVVELCTNEIHAMDEKLAIKLTKVEEQEHINPRTSRWW